MVSYVLKRISRRPGLSLAGLIIAGAFCFVLCYLVQYRNGLEKRLEEVRNSYDVVCVVTDSRGIRSEGLGLNQRFMEFVQDKEKGLGQYVKEMLVTVQMPVKTALGHGFLVGVSGRKSYNPINPAMGGQL
ncbi:MAG: hypothetical protein J6H18_05090 [Lachnospiraceae bacterium]|nr:hypothetical protein [Lachnospiraceae bacterium]